jgi:Zn-dependent peptidase ImmA (M78 family)
MKDSIVINSNAIDLRKRLGVDVYSPLDIFSILSNEKDLTLIYFPMSKNISGMCIKDKSNQVIAVNSETSYGRQRFTISHELCHLYFHKDFKKMVCGKKLTTQKDLLEVEANRFASFFLAPYEALQYYIDNWIKKKNLELEHVIKIEQYFGMSHEATLFRLQLDGFLSASKVKTMKDGIVSSALRLGYDDKLYISLPEHKKYAVYGKYIHLAEDILKQGKISNGKYEELLMDGFRADIVYGIEDKDCFD